MNSIKSIKLVAVLLLLLLTNCEPYVAPGPVNNRGDCFTCDQEQNVLVYKQRANSIPECISCSYCAAMFTAKCFLERGCYKEAGAETEVTRSQLEDLIEQNRAYAAALGNSCP